MNVSFDIPEPFQFNPLKHHLAFIREFVSENELTTDKNAFIRKVRRIGTSIMDVYSGKLMIEDILDETGSYLKEKKINVPELFADWAGRTVSEFRMTELSDSSQWILKFHDSERRYVHIFPARLSPHTFRVKANTLKSAIAYLVVIGKDFITESDLNRTRMMIDLSPVREVAETESITEMIDIIRNG